MARHRDLPDTPVSRPARLPAAALWLACAAALPGPAPAEGPPAPVVAFTVVDGRAIPESLTGVPGDPARGRALFLDARVTGCSSCHSAGSATAAPAGSYGSGGAPAEGGAGRALVALDDVGARLEPGEIRLWLVDPAARDPASAMPAYYLPGQRRGADDPLYNGPRLTAAEIEDLVAWLATLGATP